MVLSGTFTSTPNSPLLENIVNYILKLLDDFLAYCEKTQDRLLTQNVKFVIMFALFASGVTILLYPNLPYDIYDYYQYKSYKKSSFSSIEALSFTFDNTLLNCYWIEEAMWGTQHGYYHPSSRIHFWRFYLAKADFNAFYVPLNPEDINITLQNIALGDKTAYDRFKLGGDVNHFLRLIYEHNLISDELARHSDLVNEYRELVANKYTRKDNIKLHMLINEHYDLIDRLTENERKLKMMYNASDVKFPSQRTKVTFPTRKLYTIENQSILIDMMNWEEQIPRILKIKIEI